MGNKPDDKRTTTSLKGLNPIGLMDGVLGGQATDWEPPMAEELESCFPGYEKFEFIDRGGMGAVYAATQTSLERRVAVKILPPEMGQDTAFVDRFHQEARLLAKLQHPHIVAIYDFGRNETGHLFIVMEYVEGTSLLDIMKQETLPLMKVLEITSQICEGLQFAHDHGVIHRDIKPTNILIDVRGRVRVADFGLAKLSAKSHQTTAQNRSGFMMGTPGYAAPEQRRRDVELDHRADVFSVGVTLYEMLTGHLPVGVFEKPSKKVQTPALLDKIIFKALKERPADRYQKAGDMRTAIGILCEKLERSLMQRAIAKRPIVSMMTSVIVGAGFIYLLDEIDKQVIHKPGTHKPAAAAAYVEGEYGPTVVRLNSSFSLVRLKLSWEEARRRISTNEGAHLASFHSEGEVREVMEKLRQLGVSVPVWTGGFKDVKTGDFQWEDGRPFDFQNWMPAAEKPPVVITEIQAKNRQTLQDSNGNTPDWIEIHNPGSKPVDLSGWHLRHITERYGFEGRLGGARSRVGADQLWIQPGEYKIIYCNESDSYGGERLSFGFQLEAQTGRIRWSDPRGNIIQAMQTDWSSFPADGSLIYDPVSQSFSHAARATPGKANPPVEDGIAFESSAKPDTPPMAILMLPDFDGRWTQDNLRRIAWSLARHGPKPQGSGAVTGD